MKRRTLSLLLAFVMVFSLFPIAAGANQPEVGHIMSLGEYPALKLETDMVISCPEDDDAYVTFTPETDGTYVFHSVFSGDTFGELFEADWQRLDSSDDCDNHFFHDFYDFCITYELEAGQTYILAVSFLNGDAGDMTVRVERDHSYEVVSEKEPTCTEEGEIVGVCTDCGYRYTVTLPASHDFYWDVIKWPTCTEEGEERATCQRCGYSYTVITDPAHDYEWTVTKEPTCTEEGEETGVCTLCGDTCVYVLAPEHDYEPTVTKAPTYTEEGEAIYTCIYCGDSFVDSVSPILNYDFYGYLVVVYGSYDDAYPVSEIVIPAEYEGLPVTVIGGYAFEDCDSMKSVIIPDSVTMIEFGAFYGCDGLASITIPSSVYYIGDWAFESCTNLSSIYFDGDAPAFGEGVFDGVTATVYYPAGDPTWTEDVMQDYGGDITWVAYNPDLFYDVPVGAFYEAPVSWALENGITTGASATSFNPNGSCLRAQVVTFLHRAEGNPAPASTRNPFTDVKSADFFYKPVLWAVEKKITNGTSATTFGSFDTCNRAAVVTFLWRAAGSPEPKSTRNPFVDVKAGDFFYKPVLWAVENSITTGVDATHFGPTSPCNRAQVVTFLYRAYN